MYENLTQNIHVPAISTSTSLVSVASSPHNLVKQPIRPVHISQHLFHRG